MPWTKTIFPNDPEKRRIYLYLQITGRLDILSVDECLELLEDAGITIYDVGQKKGMYQLARYGDTGDYSKDNCRFITVQENINERDDRPAHVLLERRRKRQAGQTKNPCKRVRFRGVEYPSLHECSQKTGIHRHSLRTAKCYKNDLEYL